MALHENGYADDPRVPPDLQLDLIKDGVEMSFAYLARNAFGQVVVGAGPWAGARLPDGMLDGTVSRLADVTCPVISPLAQIELKEMFPVWMPERPRRLKDAADIARLRRALSLGRLSSVLRPTPEACGRRAAGGGRRAAGQNRAHTPPSQRRPARRHPTRVERGRMLDRTRCAGRSGPAGR